MIITAVLHSLLPCSGIVPGRPIKLNPILHTDLAQVNTTSNVAGGINQDAEDSDISKKL